MWGHGGGGGGAGCGGRGRGGGGGAGPLCKLSRTGNSDARLFELLKACS